MTLSLLEIMYVYYSTYLFLSYTTTMTIYLVLACIYKHIHNSFFKAVFLEFNDLTSYPAIFIIVL